MTNPLFLDALHKLDDVTLVDILGTGLKILNKRIGLGKIDPAIKESIITAIEDTIAKSVAETVKEKTK